MREFFGIGASEGNVSGPAVVFTHKKDFSENPVKREALRTIDGFYAGRRILCEELKDMASEAKVKFGGDRAGIYEGFIEILMDDEIEDLVKKFLEEGFTAAEASLRAFAKQACDFEELDSDYLKERASDLRDLGRRLAGIISGEQSEPPLLKEPCILVADDLSPFETIRLDQSLVLGLAIDRGGYTGHVAILARTLGIPCVIALEKASANTKTGGMCALDGGAGRYVTNPDSVLVEQFRVTEEKRLCRIRILAGTAKEEARTKDGVLIKVCANIGSHDEAVNAAASGADGAGLFRTEFLYMNSGRLPAEEEQFASYRDALLAFDGKPVTIRTLDIGGDKEHPGLGLEREDNPFLGYRGIRYSLDRPDVFKPQLRAILRASVYGNAEIMFPMAVSPDEFTRARSIIEECRAELSGEGKVSVPKAGSPRIGIMVETPAAALVAPAFATLCDFFSIGTNDLTQYTLASDRGNPRVGKLYDLRNPLYDPLNPAVLRLLAMTCEAAAGACIPVSVCGELAADITALPFLIGMGVGKLSVPAARIPEVKAAIRGFNSVMCKKIALMAVKAEDAVSVRRILMEKK